MLHYLYNYYILCVCESKLREDITMEQQSNQGDKEVQVILVRGDKDEVQVVGEDKDEMQIVGDNEVEAVEQVSCENNCEMQVLSVMEDEKEEHANENDSNKTLEVLPVNNGFLIDTIGKPFQDNIVDPTARREPLPACIDSESDSDSESDTSSSSVSSLSSFSSLEDLKDADKDTNTTRQPKSVKTKGELGIEDLPPVQELTISVPEDDMQKIGKVYSIVDQLVVVESHENSPPLDLDSVLFLNNGKPLGHIFDVFGPVKQPYYLVRYNSNEDIIKKGINKEDSVFYAPAHSEVTNFIFTDELMRQKGSDASWEHNNEPPEEHIDFSDDEKEMAARKKRAAKNRKPNTQEDDVPPKQPNTSKAKSGRDAATPDVTVVFASQNNKFRHYERSGSVPLTSANPPVNCSSFTFHHPNQNVASSYRSPKLSVPSPFQPGQVQKMPSYQGLARGMTTHQWPPQSMPPQQQPPESMLSQQWPPQQQPRQSMTPQQWPLQSMPPQGIPPQQQPPQGMPPQQQPLQCMPQQPLQCMPPQQRPLQCMPSQQQPPQCMPSQQQPPQCMPPQRGFSQGLPPQLGPPQGMQLQQGSPQSIQPYQGPIQGIQPQQRVPQGLPSQQGLSQSISSPQIFQQSSLHLSSCSNPVNSTSVLEVNQNIASLYKSPSSQQVVHMPSMTSPPPSVTPSRTYSVMPETSRSQFSSSGASPLGAATPPQWAVPSQGPHHSSDQQYLCNWNSFAPTNNLLQGYNKNSTQTSSYRFQTQVPQKFSFTENVQPRFGAPAVLPSSGLYHVQSTSFTPRSSNF